MADVKCTAQLPSAGPRYRTTSLFQHLQAPSNTAIVSRIATLSTDTASDPVFPDVLGCVGLVFHQDNLRTPAFVNGTVPCVYLSAQPLNKSSAP
jgi:hypothetical protein